MTNLEKYGHVFCEVFELTEDKLGQALLYQSIPNWDSVGHMSLMSALEEQFGIMLDVDDIVNFSSYEIGKEILRKYGVEL